IAPESALISQSKRLLADAYVGLGKFDLAETAAREALVVAEKINERVEIAGCYRVFALIDREKGNKQGCREWFKKACDIYTMIKSRYELAVTRYLAAKSGIYDDGERSAMLYLAREYFQSEDVHKFVEKIDRELNARPKVEIKNIKSDNHAPVFIAASPKMIKIVELAENVAQSDLNILLTGPTGAGKDQLAKYIHYCSGRKGEFVIVNAAAIPDSMVESELFGYRKGAFTGAERDNPGLMVEADGGTFYLNEIADAAKQLQVKLLEVIENKTIRPLGGITKRKVDIRIIAATNHDLEARMREGKFRPDLFHRLNVVPMALPPLSDRSKDIPLLTRHFLEKNKVDMSDANQKTINDFCRFLSNRNWPGNVRELMAFIDRLNVLAGGDIDLMLRLARDGSSTEREILLNILNETGWNRHETARILGISEGTVRNRIRQFDLKRGSSA
ncbi:MAG: sigma 54-interacting transcriptional regulator, partial [Candidatus Zixiibacteriota bacterium]